MAAVGWLFLCALAPVHAESMLFFNVTRGADGPAAVCEFQIQNSLLQREPLEAGLKTRMLFTVQLMERRPMGLAFLGDTVLAERTVEYIGYKDFLEDRYVLERDAGAPLVFERAGDFFRAFTRCERLPLAGLVRAGADGRFYLRAQARYFPVKLLAPLTLVYVFSSRDVVESEWKSAALP